MLDVYGTPYTRALHVVERYQPLDYEAAREGLERDAKESLVIPNTCMQRDPAYRGKYLKLLFYGGRSRGLQCALGLHAPKVRKTRTTLPETKPCSLRRTSRISETWHDELAVAAATGMVLGKLLGGCAQPPRRPILRRRHSERGFEQSAEMGGIIETPPIGDLGYVGLGIRSV